MTATNHFISVAWLFATVPAAGQSSAPAQTAAGLSDNQGAPIQISTSTSEPQRMIPLHMETPAQAEVPPTAPIAASTAPGKVIATFMDRNIMKLVLETQGPLIPGRIAYVGKEYIQITIGDLLSHPESRYYYSASVRGKQKIVDGDALSLSPSPAAQGASFLSKAIQENYIAEQKRVGTVTAVQGGWVLIDKGTMNQVRERDLYRVYDSTGHYEGMLEIHGLGDLQSSGNLYNALEDWHRDAGKVQTGDRVVFAGQRKLFALGFLGGQTFKGGQVLDGKENIFGGGLVWDVTFPDGWGAEVLFGAYVRDGEGHHDVTAATAFTTPCAPAPCVPFVQGPFAEPYYESNLHRAVYIAPAWLKKNFFYPRVVSPFLAAGPALFFGLNKYAKSVPIALAGNQSTVVDAEKRKVTVIPALGAGIEFFQGRFFRPRFEVRYFPGPNLVAGGNTFYTESVFYSVGFLTTW